MTETTETTEVLTNPHNPNKIAIGVMLCAVGLSFFLALAWISMEATSILLYGSSPFVAGDTLYFSRLLRWPLWTLISLSWVTYLLGYLLGVTAAKKWEQEKANEHKLLSLTQRLQRIYGASKPKGEETK